MYTYVKAVCLRRTTGAQWKEEDLSNILVYDIYGAYEKVYLELTNSVLNKNEYIDFAQLRSEFASSDKTLTELLVYIGNKTLETVSELPSQTISYAKYSDAFQSGYYINTCKIGTDFPVNYPESGKPDLKITRPGFDTDMDMLHDYCLLSVNGMIHMTDSSSTVAYIKDGAISSRHARNNHVGITSFLNIGKLTKVPLTLENIYRQEESELKSRAYFWVDQDLTNKTAFMVLGGYLVFPEAGVFWQSGERTFAINFAAMPFVERFMESRKLIDLSSLGLSSFSEGEEVINVQELLSDDVLKKYLMLSQSFLVIVDTPNLFMNRRYIDSTGIPGMFISGKDITYPLVVGNGKLAEYWKTYEQGKYMLSVQDTYYRNFTLSFGGERKLQNVSNHLLPSQSFFKSRGGLLEIGGYK